MRPINYSAPEVRDRDIRWGLALVLLTCLAFTIGLKVGLLRRPPCSASPPSPNGAPAQADPRLQTN